MKTITTFIIALTTLILSGVVFIYTINIVKYIPTTFYNIDKSESYTFSFTFVLASVLSFILTMSLISVSIKYFTLYLKYYNNYMLNKRDREIKAKVETAKYTQLYEDLRDCETVELKEAVLNTFYSTKEIAKQNDFKRFTDMVDKDIDKDRNILSNLKASQLSDKILSKPTQPPIKKIPTPHSLMGFLDNNLFGDIIFEEKK